MATIIENKSTISKIRAGGQFTILVGHNPDTGLCERKFTGTDLEILRKLEELEADNQKLAPTDSGKVRMDRLRKIDELRIRMKQLTIDVMPDEDEDEDDCYEPESGLFGDY